MRVLLVDDHPLWRRTMRQVLDDAGDMDVVAEASDGSDALDAAANAAPDIVVMDIDMPGADGVAATRALLAAQPALRILIVSASSAREHVIGALTAGAAGYVLKTSGAHEMRDAMARVAAGEVVVPPELTAHLVETVRDPSSALPKGDPIDELTEREREVLALMADGYSNQSICDAVQLSPKTVEGYIASIFSKLGLEPTRDRHRRVVAVIRFLESQSRQGDA